MKDFCPICHCTTEQLGLWNGNLYCVDCLRKNYPDIYHQRKANDSLCSKKTNWKYHPWRIVHSRSEREEVLIEYFSSPKISLFTAFITASFCTLVSPFVAMSPEFKEDMGDTPVIVFLLLVAVAVWLFFFVFALCWIVFGNMILWLRGKKTLFAGSRKPR